MSGPVYLHLAGMRPDAQEPAPCVNDCRTLVLANQPVRGDYWHLTVQASGPALTARAGQFFNIACPRTAQEQPFLRRPMSVYRVGGGSGDRLEFLYKVTGAGTRGLATLRPGQPLPMLGPLGNGFWLEDRWRHIVVLGRGVGLATLAPLAEMAAAAGIGVTAILSARTPDVIMSVDRFAAIRAQIEVVTDTDGSSGVANVEPILRSLIGQHRADAFFTCGSNRLLLLMQRLGEAFGIPGQVALEQQMACGLGMCFCCVRSFRTEQGVESRRVCCEGPVFKLDEAIAW
jgi:dihydroorotate dehydrogenase electron transfer subunit